MMKGVFLDTETMKPEELDFGLLESAIAEWQYFPWTQANEIADRIADVDVVITNKTVIGDTEMQNAKNLKLICISATGTNNVDLKAARKRGITVCNVSGYAQGAVVQHTFALMLALATNWHRYQRASYDGTWSKSPMFCLLDFPVTELAGKTLGIIGYGSLGKKVASVAKALDMNVIVCESPQDINRQNDAQPTLTDVSKGRTLWHDFLKQSDFISLHCPLSEYTENLINTDALANMKSTAFLVNTARGGIVNEADLIQALNNKQIAGAALDVLSVEPPPADHPVIQANLPNLLLTPHSAWVSTEARQRLLDGVANNIIDFFNDQPNNVVNA